MKKYCVTLTIERVATAIVEANDEKEAREKAMSFSNLTEEGTESEDIKSVDDVEEYDAEN